MSFNAADDTAQAAYPDFSQLLELPESAFALPTDQDIDAPPQGHTSCASHPEHDDCLCFASPDESGVLPPSAHGPHAPQAADYAKFEDWIPLFIRPEKPCDYCRSRRLNCYITRGDRETSCTPCNSLFRECSLSNTNTLETANQSTGFLLDTLHVVDEDRCTEQGALTGIKTMISKGNGSGTATPNRGDDAQGSSKRNGIRFPRHAVKALRDWLDAHADNPYPNEKERAELESKTQLSQTQISNWLANARRRRKATDKAQPRVCASPSLRPQTGPMPIPGATEKPWEELNPLERWKHSPPENEPATVLDIANAVANTDLPEETATSPSSYGRGKRSSKESSGASNKRRAPSISSMDTGRTSSQSNSTVWSHGSSGSFGSFSSSLAGKKDRRRRRRATPAPRTFGDEKKRIFQCTFCTDTFKSKYDWTRHEKSLHLSLEKWICAPLGPVITDSATGKQKCVYCDHLEPDKEHVESHHHRQCEEKGVESRTFYRKDHLRQHIRLMHECDMTTGMDNWKFIAVSINSRCGFCDQRFTVWQHRVDHLTAHFKAGARMSEWKGCRGLDPAVAAQVTNAMPPYLIGAEGTTVNPFSATKRMESSFGDPADTALKLSTDAGAWEGNVENNTMGTCWEVLTIRLGKFANEMVTQGVLVTDELLQARARRILYDSDDAWNQTAADNPEWLDLFKKAHGLNYIPNTLGGQGNDVPEDLETYGDLGLRVPFVVQLQAYNKMRGAESGPATLSNPGDLLNPDLNQGADSLHQQALTTARNDPNSPFHPRHRYELPPHRARQFATVTPAWTASGAIPAPISTASLTAPHALASTADAPTAPWPASSATEPASLPAPDNDVPPWAMPMTAAEEAQMLGAFDKFLATSSEPWHKDGVPAAAPLGEARTGGEMSGLVHDPMMAGWEGDGSEMDFDGVFDMHLDEPFGTGGGGLR